MGFGAVLMAFGRIEPPSRSEETRSRGSLTCAPIARRLGWVRPTQKDKHCAPRDMDRLQSKIPPELRYSLHVNLISLGREICTKTPRCEECPIAAWCPKIGVARSG